MANPLQSPRPRDPASRARLNLEADQRAWLEAARAHVDEQTLAATLARLVDTPSPTGSELAVAEIAAEELRAAGLEAQVQSLDASSANAIGTLRGTGGGPALLLYGHLDTHLSGDDGLDAPAADGPLPASARPRAFRDGRTLCGLGAGNPKGYAACMILAARAAAAAGPLSGNLVVGLAARGMPASGGYGSGCRSLLEHISPPAYALIGKPGWAVAWEEAGVCIFRLRVRGELAYAGTRHVLRYENPIAAAGRLASALEEWAIRYAARNESGCVRPQAVVGAIRAGWPTKPTFVPAWADLWLDVRFAPGSSAGEVESQLHEAVAASGVKATTECVVEVPATATDPESRIVQSCIRAWEDAEGRAHEPLRATSGSTDAAILRSLGIPTARLGLPADARMSTPTLDADLDAIDIPGAVAYARTVLYVIADIALRASQS